MSDPFNRGNVLSRTFTPAPWSVVVTNDGRRLINGRDGFVCSLDQPSCAEQVFNSRLIAAAPDMLAALKQIEAEMRAGPGSSYGETREQVKRAIRKAEGSE